MQIKFEIIKFKQIIAGVIGAIIIFILISFIFFSALQSSSIFEMLLHDIYKIKIDLISLCESKEDDGTVRLDRIYALDTIDMLDKGLFRYKMVLSESGNSVVDSLYYLLKNKLIQSTNDVVFSEKEYSVLEKNLNQIQSYILESSREQKRALSILFSLLLLTVAIFLFLFIMASVRIDKEKRLHKYQRDLAKNISESENRIHNLLSSELHDDVGQMLVFLKMKLIETNSTLSKDIDPIIDSVRNLSHNLKIPEFSRGQLTTSVEELFSKFCAVSSIRVEYTLSDFHNELYPDYYPIIIFRVIQECLQNAVKHSKAENIRINMVESSPFLIIRYKDDGIGINGNTIVLRSIEERAKLLNAELRIDTGINKGLLIVMKIPFVKEQD
ncbi:MAG: hypothetical protein DRP58_09650 [Spirochaetes bacterium]|nr:MAG: hypothetical protein DRP58_09650 [Spirochaetota bacterium]